MPSRRVWPGRDGYRPLEPGPRAPEERSPLSSTPTRPWKGIEQDLEGGSDEELRLALSCLSRADLALEVSRLGEAQRTRVLTALSPADAAGLVDRLPGEHVGGWIEGLEPEAAAAIIEELPSSEQADLIGILGATEAAAILERMDPEEAEDARALARYDSDVAGYFPFPLSRTGPSTPRITSSVMLPSARW